MEVIFVLDLPGNGIVRAQGVMGSFSLAPLGF